VNSVSAEFVAARQNQTIFYLPQPAGFQPPAPSRLFTDAGGPNSSCPWLPSPPEPLKHTDGVLSDKLYFEGFRSSVARVPVPLPIEPQKFAIAGRRSSVAAGQREGKLTLWFECVELEPGNTSRFQMHLLQDGQEIIRQGTAGQFGQSGWPAFLSPILRTDASFEFSPQVSVNVLASASPPGREMLIFDEEFRGREERSFRIDHFRPAELSLPA